jgi:hypothetical protein
VLPFLVSKDDRDRTHPNADARWAVAQRVEKPVVGAGAFDSPSEKQQNTHDLREIGRFYHRGVVGTAPLQLIFRHGAPSVCEISPFPTRFLQEFYMMNYPLWSVLQQDTL